MIIQATRVIANRKDNRHLLHMESWENRTTSPSRLFRVQIYFTLRRDEFANACMCVSLSETGTGQFIRESLLRYVMTVSD